LLKVALNTITHYPQYNQTLEKTEGAMKHE